MTFSSPSPAEQYISIQPDGVPVFVNPDDTGEPTVTHIKALYNKHGLHHHARQVYYLRGHRKKADHEQVLIGVLESALLPPELNEIVHCLSFWNQEGKECYDINRKGQESYADFILRCVAADCRALIQPYSERFLTGNGGNHVWVADGVTKGRLLIIHF